MRNRLLGIALAAVCGAVPLQAQHLALFLTDGARLDVREYEVVGPRVRYFSVDRAQWEEVPRELVDLERTKRHNASEAEAARVRQEEVRRERSAERIARTELHRVPLADGVYYLQRDRCVPLEQAEYVVGKSKGRTVLNVLAPVPAIPGKQTLAVGGLAAKAVTTGDKPAFYLRLERFSHFGIVRVTPEKRRKRRVVQQIYTVPQADEQFEEQEEVQVFRQQLAPLVYKIWPTEALPGGEYAVIDFTPGKSNLRVWDFSHRPTGAAPTR